MRNVFARELKENPLWKQRIVGEKGDRRRMRIEVTEAELDRELQMWYNEDSSKEEDL